MSKVDLKILDDGTSEVIVNDEKVLKVLKCLNYNIEDNIVKNLNSEAASSIVKIATKMATNEDEVYIEAKLAMVQYAIADLLSITEKAQKNDPEIIGQLTPDNILEVFSSRFAQTIAVFAKKWDEVFSDTEDDSEATSYETNIEEFSETDQADLIDDSKNDPIVFSELKDSENEE